MAGSRSFKEYVASRFDNEIFNEISSYLINNKDRLTLRLYNVEYIDWIELQDATVKHVQINDLPGSEIEFDILVEADIYVQQRSNRYGETEEDTTAWFRFSCRGDLEKNLDDVVVADPEEFVTKSYHEKPLDDSLVPYIKKTEYDTVAADFLKAAGYDAALTAPMHIDPLKVAQTFGLTIEKARLSKDRSLFGRIYFCDDEVDIYDDESDEPTPTPVKAKTIYVDPMANYLKNFGQLDNTIIHECFHWYKHKKAYELERLYNEHATSIGCMVVGGVEGDSRESTKWMERQANSITPRIQIPLQSLKVHVANLIAKYKKQGYEYPDMLQPVIDEVALFYNVSRTAAKIRLIDAGFHEAAGTFNYVDGGYVRPHYWKKDSIEVNQTFTIGYEDAIAYSFLDLDLRKAVESGKYEYVESHFVLRSPKYIITDEDGCHIMTEYARFHMDQCALVFDLSLKNADAYGESYHTECFLNKDEHSPFEFDFKFRPDLAGAVKEDPTGYMDDFFTRVNAVADGFTKDFCKCMQDCRKFADLTYGEIHNRVEFLSEKQIERIFRGESQGTFESIVAIIFAMELPSQLSLPLMERSPHPFILGKQDHIVIRNAMCYLVGKDISEVRKYLSKHDIQI
ncbi:hypothetical protein [Mogibacterium timidum]